MNIERIKSELSKTYAKIEQLQKRARNLEEQKKQAEDMEYLITSNAGDNSVTLYKRDRESGLLTKLFCLPISGEYPKDAAIFPDDRHMVSLNHENNTMTFFSIDLKKNLIVMNGKEIKIHKPNCIIFQPLTEQE